MATKTRLLLVLYGTLSLCACTSDYFGGYDTYQSNPKQGSLLYPEGYDSPMPAVSATHSTALVPPAYQVSAHAPIPPKSLDKLWISNQSSYGYTIELADSSKPLAVALAMNQAPKNARMAEIKYHKHGQSYYKAVYGSYDSYQSAEQALKTLPAALQPQAQIKAWQQIQTLS